MKEFERLTNIIGNHIELNKCSIKQDNLYLNTSDIDSIKEKLIIIGDVIEYNKENSELLLKIRIKESNYTDSYVALLVKDKIIYIVAVSKEGIFKQHIAKKNINRVKNILLNKKNNVIKNLKRFIVVIVALALFAFISIYYIDDGKYQKYLNNYSNVINNYNNTVKEYNELASSLYLNNIDIIDKNIDLLNEQVLMNEVSKKNVKSKCKYIEEELINLIDKYASLQNINHPSEEQILNALYNIEEITDICPVSKDNDPNGLLNKEKGYYSCIYFKDEAVDQSIIPGNTTIEKGTDCGGAIELFNNSNDALERCNYLEQFDDTLLYSGSHEILGTIIIRTSYLLSSDDQLKLTNNIIQEILKSK